MLQTLLCSRMACSSTFLKYISAVLGEVPLTYILMNCNASSSVLLLCVAPNSIKAQIELSNTSVYENEFSSSDGSAINSHFSPGGRGGGNDNDAHSCEPKFIIMQNKIIEKNTTRV